MFNSINIEDSAVTDFEQYESHINENAFSGTINNINDQIIIIIDDIIKKLKLKLNENTVYEKMESLATDSNISEFVKITKEDLRVDQLVWIITDEQETAWQIIIRIIQ